MRADNPNAAAVKAYFGDDESLYEARSPVTHAAHLDVPVFIAVAEHENPLLDVYGAEFLHRVSAARGRAPRFMRLPDHNHISIVAHFNSGEETLGRGDPGVLRGGPLSGVEKFGDPSPCRPRSGLRKSANPIIDSATTTAA